MKNIRFLIVLVCVSALAFRYPGYSQDHEHDAHEHDEHDHQHELEDHGHNQEDAHENEETGDEHDHDHEDGEGHEEHKPANKADLHQGTEEDSHDHESYDHGNEQSLKVDANRISRLQIAWQEARAGSLDSWIQAPGEITIPENHIAHIVPRVKGVSRKITVQLGQNVKQGQVLAVIESRELADAKAEYLAALERQDLAARSFEREEGLFKKKISSEEEFLKAKQAYMEAKIRKRVAGQKLIALGLSPETIKQLPERADNTLTSYELKAPFTGSIIRKHIVHGEVVDDTSEVFVLADLTVLNADLNVNSRDIVKVERGQPAEILVDNIMPWVPARVNYVEPLINRNTRSAIVRMDLDNSNGNYRPGTFVTGRVRTEVSNNIVAVPVDAVQNVEDQECVFIRTADGFAMRPVTTGKKNRTHIEIVAGLEEGELVVVKNAFHLKAELTKGAGGAHAGHSH